MLSAAYTGQRTFTVTETADPSPGAGEVAVAVAYTGICGTDLHIFHGDMDQRVSIPAVIGHEMSGTIAAVGDGVEGWSVGDPVTRAAGALVRHGARPAWRATSTCA